MCLCMRECGLTLITGVYLGRGVTSGKENIKKKWVHILHFSSMLCCILTESKSVSSPHPLAFPPQCPQALRNMLSAIWFQFHLSLWRRHMWGERVANWTKEMWIVQSQGNPRG